MALFGKKNKTDAAPEKKAAPEPKTSTGKLTLSRDLASVIIRPRITEKAALAIDQNVYTFEVSRDATKYDVRDAIAAIYEVTPVKVHIVNKKPRQYMSRARNRTVTEKGRKKAYVYLKKGDHITLA